MTCERPPRPLLTSGLRAVALALRAKAASRHLFDVASTPPHRGGEYRARIFQFNSCILSQAASTVLPDQTPILAPLSVQERLGFLTRIGRHNVAVADEL